MVRDSQMLSHRQLTESTVRRISRGRRHTPIPKIEDLRYPLLSPGIVRPPVTVPYVNFPPFEGALEGEPRYSPSMIRAFAVAGTGGTNTVARYQDKIEMRTSSAARRVFGSVRVPNGAD
ncbi:hypothetical protein EDD18DRAFT_1116364 [Armillaria luteobubalina]|uniref:Uncharacterized protein n=1 Tax=Armillaria luteobubalina TaxID=153913 RepID=A0AA39NZC6_9AGAR|nr:hypothetical protein EDD18DRAFT_1116364 [Armillaria luteobubalina]